MTGEMALYSLSTLIVVIGGISLILQKVYKVESATGETTVIEVPFFGKLTTNYPAIAFVFIGAALAAYTIGKTSDSSDRWIISGSFRAPQEEGVQWDRGNLRLSPKKFHISLSPDGRFEIQGDIPKGHQFEEEVKQITYENCACNGKFYGASILVEREYNNYLENKESFIEHSNKTTRRYKPIDVNVAIREPKQEAQP
jgi:hypothetical protein